MLTLDIDPRQLRELERSLDGMNRKLENEMRIAVRATTRKAKTVMSRQVRTELAAPARSVNQLISTQVTGGFAPSGEVRLRKTKRLPLKAFKPRQTRKGVSYRISKRTGRNRVAGAFISPKLGNHVYKRRGKSRLPIDKLHGPSPWGVFVLKRMKPPSVREIQGELRKQVDRRIKFNVLKRSGRI